MGRFLQTDPIGYEDQVNLYAYVGNDPVNLVDPTGLRDVELKFTVTKTIVVSINDNLGSSNVNTAETVLTDAAQLTSTMDQNGTLPNSSNDAISALNGITVSNDMSGLNPKTNTFNINMTELNSTASSMANQGSGAAQATAISVAGDIVHDGTHAVQNNTGVLPSSNYASLPKAGSAERVTFDNAMIATERGADAAQIDFLKATGGPSHVVNHLVNQIQTRSNNQIRRRFFGR